MPDERGHEVNIEGGGQQEGLLEDQTILSFKNIFKRREVQNTEHLLKEWVQ